ncbi:M15 family metallopeptidase [Ornithinimicrobium sufpigmenti]|uniref:M15 family metallopeptidase n=1 Tax=Ornithinimicrobium sufpigmenti TaxID=2508882 RepID=UPI001036BC66|nr:MULTISPECIES: M15 family metallopeptidase [unclassified Ornithinimicrobium]
MSAPAPAPHAEDVQPGRRAHGSLPALLRRRQQVVLRRRRAAALGLVAVVAVSGFAVTRGGMPFSGADPSGGQVEAQAAAVAVPPPPPADRQGATVAAGQDPDALTPTGPGEPCRAEPGGAEIASGPVGGAAFGASALGCTIPAWQALPPTPLEATDARMLLAQVTREQAVDPVDYVPEDLVPLRGGVYQARAEVGEQLDALFAAAAEAGHPSLTVTSGFRSHETQAGTFADWAGRLGEERADLLSARPGHSEHQLGLAVDLGGTCNYQCFGASPEGQWVAANAHRWGFIVRYPQDGQAVTGYAWEPWHLRYVGPRAAWGMHLAGEAYWEHFQPVAARAAGVH